MERQLFESQFLLQFLHQTRLFLFRIEFFRLFQAVETVLAAVHERQFQQVFLVAALRHEELHAAQLPLHCERHYHLLCLASEPAAYVGDGRNEQFRVGFIEFPAVFKRETLVHRPLYDFIVDVPAQFARVSLQYLACLGYALTVVLHALPPRAGCVAVVYVVFQARFVLALGDAFGCNRDVALARFVEFAYQFEHGVHACRVRIGSVVGSPFAVYLACLEYSRQIFARDTDAGVGLSVFKEYVVAGVVLLYKTVFEQQRVLFGVHHGVAYVFNLRHQNLCLESIYLLVEVARHTLLQPFGLAYIYNGVVLVVELVASGFVGHAQDYAFQSFYPLQVVFLLHL